MGLPSRCGPEWLHDKLATAQRVNHRRLLRAECGAHSGVEDRIRLNGRMVGACAEYHARPLRSKPEKSIR